jgi:hypothetical protein
MIMRVSSVDDYGSAVVTLLKGKMMILFKLKMSECVGNDDDDDEDVVGGLVAGYAQRMDNIF